MKIWGVAGAGHIWRYTCQGFLVNACHSLSYSWYFFQSCWRNIVKIDWDGRNWSRRIFKKVIEMKWKSFSRVRLFATPWPIVHGILQARILESLAFPFSRGSSQPRDWTQVSHIVGGFFTSWATGKPKDTGVGSLSLLQWIFPTQESNRGLLHYRGILYQLSYQSCKGR